MRLELKKRILKRVSFDKEMFSVELENSMLKLNRAERQDLKDWVKSEFGTKYPDTIDRVFIKEARRIKLGV